MKHFSKILIVILCLLISSIVFYYGLKIQREKSENIINNNREYSNLDEENILNSDIYNEESRTKKVDDELRKEFITHSEANFNKLAPFPSDYKENWDINRISFVNNNNFYVEYNDEHTLNRILVYCVKSDKAMHCSRISYFVPNNFTWEIDTGDDPFLGKNLQYYEKNETGNWKKTFKSTEIFYFPVSNDTLEDTQQAADEEKNSWRFDPITTIKQDITNIFRFDLEDVKVKIISQERGKILSEVRYQNSIYEVYLTQPVKIGEEGIWIIQYLKYVK